MPGKTAAAVRAGAEAGGKRKRISDTKQNPVKRARSESIDDSGDASASDDSAGEEEEEEEEDDHDDPRAGIIELQNAILESKKNYNDITKLIEFAKSFEEDPDSAALASVALTKVFMTLLAGGSLSKKKGAPERETVVITWLRDRFFEYKQVLLELVREDELGLPALTLAMKVLKSEAQYLQNTDEQTFPQIFLQQIIVALLDSESDDARGEFLEKYLAGFDDIRFYTLKSIKNIIEKPEEGLDEEDLFDASFALLSAVGSVPKELDSYYIDRPKKKANPVNSLHQHQRAGQEAWLAVLRLARTKADRKQALEIMSTDIAPWFTRPELLSDFLTDAYDAGGSTSLLALSGVFYLIRERNLDYPSFYAKLYSLLDRDILHSKHRSRFFRLLDTFLGSTHIPAALVASFLKRLARLALNAPPAAIVFIVPWTYNLLKRHPTCTFMLHRVPRTDEARKLIEDKGAEDPFLPDETDPMETQAIESCLWELVQLQSHYHPNVATIVKIISEQFTKQSYNIEDFLDHSYGSLLDAELSKDVKKPPVLEFHIPKKVFMPHEDVADAVEGDSLAVKLFDFA